MTRSTVLTLVLAACALSTSASPVGSAAPAVKIPFDTHFRAGTATKESGATHIIKADRARVEAIKSAAAARKAADAHDSGKKRASTSPNKGMASIKALNTAVTYTVNVSLSDGIQRTLLVDTGSSNTWVGAAKHWNATDCFADLYIEYGLGSVDGSQCYDDLTLAPGLVIKKQSVGSATYADGFAPLDGILGIGPVDLTVTSTDMLTDIPTVTDNLYTQKLISTDAVGIYYAPATVNNPATGELTFGGADSTAYVGQLKYTKLTTTSPASTYWGVNQTASYGKSTIMGMSSGIVDTGTTLVYLPTNAYNAYVKATGAVFDETAGLLAITQKQYAALQPLSFDFGTAGTYTLSPNAQIWPRALNAAVEGNKTATYLVVADMGVVSGSGLDFITGYTFLERFYSVYDTTNNRFGIAQTSHTNANTN